MGPSLGGMVVLAFLAMFRRGAGMLHLGHGGRGVCDRARSIQRESSPTIRPGRTAVRCRCTAVTGQRVARKRHYHLPLGSQ
jgi:hypothetical protein